MRKLTLVISLFLSVSPAFAQTATAVRPCATATCGAASAPLIGTGISAALAIGGVLLGCKFLRRRR